MKNAKKSEQHQGTKGPNIYIYISTHARTHGEREREGEGKKFNFKPPNKYHYRRKSQGHGPLGVSSRRSRQARRPRQGSSRGARRACCSRQFARDSMNRFPL